MAVNRFSLAFPTKVLELHTVTHFCPTPAWEFASLNWFLAWVLKSAIFKRSKWQIMGDRKQDEISLSRREQRSSTTSGTLEDKPCSWFQTKKTWLSCPHFISQGVFDRSSFQDKIKRPSAMVFPSHRCWRYSTWRTVAEWLHRFSVGNSWVSFSK